MKIFISFLVILNLPYAKATPPQTCGNTNVVTPIKIMDRNYYCGVVPLGEGADGIFFPLVDENQRETKFGIKVFHEGRPVGMEKEIEDIRFFRQFIKSIPDIIQFHKQNDPKKKLSNYIIKPRIIGTNLWDLYQSGCFLEPDELEDQKAIERCNKLTGNSNSRALMDGLRKLLGEIKAFDKKNTGHRFEDTRGENILWDRQNKAMVLIDFLRGKTSDLHFFEAVPEGDQSSFAELSGHYNSGDLFNDSQFASTPAYLELSGLSRHRKRKGCIQKQKLQNLFRELGIYITNRNDVSKLDCSTIAGKEDEREKPIIKRQTRRSGS